jgi:[NiFe] hydrogenase diaphorase moiety small subunit
VFAIAGRGLGARLIVNAASGRLADTPIAATDQALAVCPTGALLAKRRGYAVPIGRRVFDLNPVGSTADGTRHG